MQVITARIRKWGGSVGVVLPKKVMTEEKLEEGDIVELNVKKKGKTMNELFGIAKRLPKITREELKEMRKTMWDE